MISMISVSAANIQFTDVSEHWAWTNGQIPYLVEKGVLQGYEQANGTYMFKPDGEITRAEIATVVNRILKIKATPDAAQEFSDLDNTHWAFGTIMAIAAAK